MGFEDREGSARRPSRRRLGEALIEQGLIDEGHLERALERQRRWRVKLGTVLQTLGLVRPLDVARTLDRVGPHRFVDLRQTPPDRLLIEPGALPFYVEHQCIPFAREGGRTLWAAVDPAAARAALEGSGCSPGGLFLTTPRDLGRALSGVLTHNLTDIAIGHLKSAEAISSADRVMVGSQVLWGLGGAAAAAAFFLLAPEPAVVAMSVFFSLWFLALAGLRIASVFTVARGAPDLVGAKRPAIPDEELPVYTIIVPLLDEAAVLPLLDQALKQLDYPAAKLDIKYVFEANDRATIEAARALGPRGNVDFVEVPASRPLTKPKACNYALQFARGDYLVIYDAEDRPDPAQLRKALAAFAAGGTRLACVQAQLLPYNWNENWLTRLFAIEYAALFDLLLPTLDRLKLPMPLGGTSTHFRTALVRSSGAWDPYNVTEDADLGLRFALKGYRCATIASTTLEEAPSLTGVWLRQRTRWLKGWMQTWLVRMRSPSGFVRAAGLRGFLGFQAVLGGFILSALVYPWFAVVLALALFGDGSFFAPGTSAALVAVNGAALVFGIGASMAAGVVAALRRKRFELAPWALTMPLYWLLISAAAYRALYQLYTNPFHWEKTPHGISRMTADDLRTLRKEGRR